MNKLLHVRRVGFLQDMPGDTRSPESFSFPACLTSLMECLGEDVKWQAFQAHGRQWDQRFLNKEILAASGMAFGLLWHPGQCFSALDLMQVNPRHGDTIRLGFDYAGYGCEMLDYGAGNEAELRRRLVESIDGGKPVLAFGIAGHPECAILCGYEQDGAGVLGWSPFQHRGMAVDFADNGMFRLTDWERDVWSLVLCGAKQPPRTALGPLLARGVAIMELQSIDGYLAGDAAYGAWRAFVSDPACRDMEEEALRQRYGYHHALVGNHAEARCYLGNFLQARAKGDAHLTRAAACMEAIHDACWQLWGVAGEVGNPEGYKALGDAEKQQALAALLDSIQALDGEARDALGQWLGESYKGS